MQLKVSILTVALAGTLFTTGCGSNSSPAATTTPLMATYHSTLAISATPLVAGLGAPVTLTATVSGYPTAVPGSVTFLDGTTTLGTATLGTGSTATFSVSSLASGSHSLSASFAGITTTTTTAGLSSSTSAASVITVQAAATTAATTSHVPVALTTPAQQIMGFGGSEAYYQNFITVNPNAPEIYTSLFDTTNGLGLTILRLQNVYRYSTAAGFDAATAALATGAQQAAGANPLTLMMASWSPPANLKANGATATSLSNDPQDTLAKVNGQYNYAGFAQYWSDSLAAYAAIGIVPNWISIQNEPDFTATGYDSCRFNPSEATYFGSNFAGYSQAFDAVYKQLQSTMKTPPKMVGPEIFGVDNNKGQAFAQALNPAEVYAFAHHNYHVSSYYPFPDAGLPALQNYAATVPAVLPGVPRFETEYFDFPGFNTAWNIHNTLAIAGDNVYLFWALGWVGPANQDQGLLYLDNPYTPSAWTQPHGWAPNDAYYAMKHYSLLVRPGYTLYPLTVDNTNERVSSYLSPDKKTLVIVLLNTSASATDTVALDLSKLTTTSSAIYRSTFSGTERYASLGALPTGNTVTLGPQAVATVKITLQ